MIKKDKDSLIICRRCAGDACYTQQVTVDINIKHCLGCGFQCTSLMVEGSEFYEAQLESLPELYKDLMWTDPETKEIWMPQAVNLVEKGMVFANGPSGDEWKWSAVKAVPVTEGDKKISIPGKEGEFLAFRMDMSTRKDFEERDYMDALQYIGIFEN